MTDLWMVIFGGDGGRISANFTWWNVGVASTFILVNGKTATKTSHAAIVESCIHAIDSDYFGHDAIKTGDSTHCQLRTMHTSAQCYAVLILLSTYETVYDKADQAWSGMFMSVLVNTAFSTLFIGIVGTRYAMREQNFWLPEVFIPSIGLLLGITASSMAVSLNACLSELTSNQSRIETYLSFGATRFEASRSIAIDAVRLAMLPTINRMSIVGLITIPGTMTGQILGGAPIWNAVRYQEIISFMITASSGIAVLGVVASCLHAVIDTKHRLRTERVKEVQIPILHGLKKWSERKYNHTKEKLADMRSRSTSDERRPLLSSN
ncbi:upf0014-domain-containing protein [Lichtheimia corymbifera JMRC:FSU:9682]|uniref:Upf0014-domain-containing protein n=1 Tax=Lichtheimia corymbifera JMRC:FSU:9682 TaxID=1263082 RepID=A0A068S3G3_9FUNG|nr:upf0014-domain-containing protein [Lichtheimia corymbifera JMRC:FSU:9682]